MKTSTMCFLILLIVMVVFLTGCRREQAPPEFELSWTAPIERVDGTPLAMDEIQSYVLHVLPPDDTGPFSETIANRGDMQNAYVYTATQPITGRYCFFLTTVDVGGLVSPQSKRICVNSKNKSDAPLFSMVVVHTPEGGI